MLLALGAADLVERLRQLRPDVVAVEGDLRGGQVPQRAGEEGLRHVLADLGDLLGGAAVGLEILREALDDRLIAPGSGEDRARAVEVGEDGDESWPRRKLVSSSPTRRTPERSCAARAAST